MEVKFVGRISRGGKNYLIVIPKALNLQLTPLLSKRVIVTIRDENGLEASSAEGPAWRIGRVPRVENSA